MGIVNVTPDSFSDGGRYLDPDAAVDPRAGPGGGGGRRARRGRRVDPTRAPSRSTRPRSVGGSSRSSAGSPPSAGVPVSVDTTQGDRGRAPRSTPGRSIVNDVAAGADPDMFRVVVDAGAGFVVMHMQGDPRTMQHAPRVRRRRRRGRRLPGRPARPRARGGRRRRRRCVPTRASASARPARHNLDAAGAPAASWSTASTSPCSSDRPARRSSPSSLGDDLAAARDDGTLATVVWASTRARASCACTTSARSPTRSALLDVMDALDAEAVA